jgi:hypothetical protein
MYKFTIVFLLFAALLSSSCAILDLPSRFLGYSTAKFEDKNAAYYEKTFKASKRTAFRKSINIIAKLKARITNQSFDKGYIIAFELSKYFDDCLDSTEAAIFVYEIAEEEVKIRIVCNNALLAKNFSDKFFEMFAISSDKWELFPKEKVDDEI